MTNNKQILLQVVAGLCLLAFISVHSFGQGGEQDLSDQIALVDDPCVSTAFDVEFNEKYTNVINLDCPNNSKITLTIIPKNEFWCGLACNTGYIYKVYANNVLITSGALYEPKTKSVNINPNHVASQSRGTITPIKVEIYCLGFIPPEKLIYTTTYEIQTIHNGEKYFTYDFKAYDQEAICEITSGNYELICCNPNLTKTFKVKNIFATEYGVEGKLSITGEASSSAGTWWKVGSKLDIAGVAKIIWKNETEKSLTFDIKGKEGVCQTIGYQIIFNVFEKNYYNADCDKDNSNDEFLYKEIIYEKNHIDPFVCESPPFNNCNKKPEIRINQKKSNNRSYDECYGSIWIEDLGNGITPSEVSISWQGPDGKIYSGLSLENVQYGKYKIIITNECCEKFEKDVILCPSYTASEWINNGEKWCRELSCDGPVNRRLNCGVTECITPDHIETYFENGKCRERHYYNGELLGIAEANDKDAEKKTEYDDFDEKCVYEYYCDGELIEIIKEEPTEIVWAYDEFWNECQKDVSCEGKWFEEVEVIEPEITWEWDDFFNECVSTYIACDGNEMEQEDNETAVNFGEWNWTSLYCYRDVYCPNNIEFEDIGIANYEVTFQDEDCDGDNYYIDLICDGEVVKTVCGVAINIPIALPRQSKSICNIKINLNDIIINKNQTDGEIYIYIHDMTAKIIMKQIASKQESTIRINLSEFPSGIYSVGIMENNQIVKNERFVKP